MLKCLIFTLAVYSPWAWSQKVESETNQVTDIEAESASDQNAVDPSPALSPNGLIPENLIGSGDLSYYSPYVVIADKTARTVYIWKHDNFGATLVKSYASDHGRKEGDKQILGDLKTPEGVYYFIKTYNKDQLDFNEYGVRAFVTDYPNLFDKRENKTGSGIWLHSIPPTKSLNRGSRGCVVVRISAIEEIQNFISLGTTPIIIEDKINYIDESKIKRQRTELLTWLEGWKRSWESKSLDAYMDYYSDQFKSKKMDKSKWKVYKEELNKKYNYISVQLSSPSIYKADKKYIVRFAQTYSSDQNSDFGEKTLYIKKENGQFKIVGENWAVASERLLAQKETITKNFNN